MAALEANRHQGLACKVKRPAAWLGMLVFACVLINVVAGQNSGRLYGQTNPFLSGQVPPISTPSAQLANPGYAAPTYNPSAYPALPTGAIPSPAVQTGLSGNYQPGVNFQVPQIPSNLPAGQTSANPFPAASVQTGVPSAGVNLQASGLDPFGNPAVNYGNVPQGYPNLPAAPSAGGGWFSAGAANQAPSGASLFGTQTPTYGPLTGYQNPGLLNNQQAYGNQTYDSQSWQRFWQQSDWQRLFHAFRMRHTFVDGGSLNDVEINDTEIATSLSFPNWLNSDMPLTISPGFASHLWQGPNSITGADLPGSAYSAYLQLDHSTALNRQFGGELSFAAGIYTAYDTVTADSLRFTGTGLGWLRLSPHLTFKAGVEYLDRVDIKMLPAGGLFWTPDANSRFNLYFPRPKISRRLPNLGNTEVWGYVSGEYGGGSWTIRREANFADQVDINDYRLMVGLEWIGIRGVTGFGEVGVAFDRELIYRSDDTIGHNLGDSFFARGGFAF